MDIVYLTVSPLVYFILEIDFKGNIEFYFRYKTQFKFLYTKSIFERKYQFLLKLKLITDYCSSVWPISSTFATNCNLSFFYIKD